jgi:DNA-binding IclR family transcriptional regulator
VGGSAAHGPYGLSPPPSGRAGKDIRMAERNPIVRNEGLKSAKTTFDIIDKLREVGGAGVSELAAELDMPTSTIHDHLRTLETEEYLVNDGGTYRVGARFLELGEQVRDRKKVYRVARPEIDELAGETGEHANLMIEEHGRGVFLYKAMGSDAVQLDTHAGLRVPLQTTALGKAILAYRPEEEVESIIDRHGLPKLTENTVTDRDALAEELASIRDRGYAFDDEERVNGMRCVATPITDENDRAIAAISVSGPKSRMLGDVFTEEMPETLLRSANVIEVNLAYA